MTVKPTSANIANANSSIQLNKTLGSDDAKVTIVEFSDFQCPYCKMYFDNTFHQLKSKYIDTGKVKYVFKNYNLPFHPEAPKAAMAGNCAFEQGKFWEMHELLFSKQDDWSGKADNVQTFKKFAGELKLDQTKFDQCLDTDKYEDEMNADMDEGQAKNVSGTPTFFINGHKLVGAQELPEFDKEIEKALAKAEK